MTIKLDKQMPCLYLYFFFPAATGMYSIYRVIYILLWRVCFVFVSLLIAHSIRCR